MFVRNSHYLEELQVIFVCGGGTYQEIRIENSVLSKLQVTLDKPKCL